MSPRSRSSLLKALLWVAAILAFTVTCTHGCRNFQSPPSADDSFGAALIAETAGYKLLLTADSARNEGCYTFKFNDNNTFTMDYSNDNYIKQMSKGYFAFHPKSFHEPGFIDLGLPPFTLGSWLFGGNRLYVIYVASDLSYFVTSSCGLFSREHLHVFGKASAVATVPAIKTVLKTSKIPQADMLREVDQVCSARATVPRDLLPLYSISLLSRPSLPMPNQPFTSHNDGPVQFVYPQIGNSVLTAGTGQVQQYYLYNPALPAVPYSGFQNGSPQPEYVATNVNSPASVGQPHVMAAGSPYYSSSSDVTYGSTAVHYP